MKKVAAILLIVFAFSCASRKTFPSEAVLFPTPGEHKIWLINTISDDFHFCSLISFETVSGNEYLSTYASVWSKKDSAFYSGIRTTNRATVAQITEFPLLLNLLKADSSDNKWNWLISGRKTVWNGELNRADSKVKIKYKTQSPFRITQVIEKPQVSMIAPISAKLRSAGKVKTESQSTFCMTVFKSEKSLTALAQTGSLVWMDLVLDDGLQFNGLFRVNEKTSSLLGYNIKDSSHYYASNRRLTIEAKDHWKSLKSGKSYPLTFIIQLPNNEKTIYIRPLIEDQEINANKSSFWMGAIEVIDPEKKVKNGSGNMYIFNK
jgi:hypothetical protein